MRRASPLWGALALLHACAFEAPSDQACEGPSRSLAEALYSGSADAGGLASAFAPPLAIGAVVTGDGAAVVCTATVIAPGIALTAAHCGGFGLPAFRLGESVAPVPIRDPIVHPVLDVMVFHFDDAGLPPLQPLALLDGSIGPDWEGELVTLAGVGQTETGDTGQLRFAREPIVAVGATELRVDGMGQSGACGGDSGGPLLVEDGSGALRIAGVLDRGAPSCLGVDVYVKVEAFAEWLRANTGISAPRDRCARRAEPCVGLAASALSFGTRDPGDLALPSSQRAAIVRAVIEDAEAGAGPTCTAVVIDAATALTARHCAPALDPLGGVLWVGEGDGEPEARLRIARVRLHPSADLALLELEDGAAVRRLGVAPIALAATPPEPGTEAVLSGFGLTEDGSRGALRFAVEPIVSVDERFVTVDGDGNSGACDGDSGGPLLGLDAAGAVRVLGLLSGGSSDCLGMDRYVRADLARAWSCELRGGCERCE